MPGYYNTGGVGREHLHRFTFNKSGVFAFSDIMALLLYFRFRKLSYMA